MAYFPNGTAGMMYEELYCDRCVHEDDDGGCAVMLAHNLYNYDDCNKTESILHLLIPRDPISGANWQCKMFREKEGEAKRGHETDRKYLEWVRQRDAE